MDSLPLKKLTRWAEAAFSSGRKITRKVEAIF